MKISKSAGVGSVYYVNKLGPGATVEFCTTGAVFVYVVRSHYMDIVNRYPENARGGNAGIFLHLGINKATLAEMAYGYPIEAGGWPPYKGNDFAALGRLFDRLLEHPSVISIAVS
jgi:hypothetical protein